MKNKTLLRRFAAMNLALLILIGVILSFTSCSNDGSKTDDPLAAKTKQLIGDGILAYPSMSADIQCVVDAALTPTDGSGILPIGLSANVKFKRANGVANMSGSMNYRQPGSEFTRAVNQYYNNEASWNFDEANNAWVKDDMPCLLYNIKYDSMSDVTIEKTNGQYIVNGTLDAALTQRIVNRAIRKISIDPRAENLIGTVELRYDTQSETLQSVQLVVTTTQPDETNDENSSTATTPASGLALDIANFMLTMRSIAFNDVNVKLPSGLPQ